MDAFLVSLGVVAIAEIGDKTQLLALILAVRFRAPFAIIAGIFVATVFNHALAAWVGTMIAHWFDGNVLAWIVSISFILMGLWALVPDDAPEEEDVTQSAATRFGPFIATVVAFFLVEMGDKTQVATAALAANYQSLVMVTLGTTLGMMVANVPAVLLGDGMAKRIPLGLVRTIAAAIFIILGLVGIVGILVQ